MMLAVSGAAMAQNLQGSSKPLPLSLTISPEQQTVVAGSPVIVKTIVTNTSGQDFGMWIQLGDPFRADVKDANGGSPPPTRWCFYNDPRFDVGRVLGASGDLDMRLLNGNGLYVTYKANGSYASSADIRYLYNVEEPGTYTIILRLAAFPAVKSNPVAVTVVPAAPSTAAAQQIPTTPPFSLELRIPATTPSPYPAKVGAPMPLQVITKNVSTHSIVLRRQEHEHDRAMLGSVFRVDVQDTQGNPAAETPLGESKKLRDQSPPVPAAMASARAAGTLICLKPGEDWRNTIRVDDLYDLSKPGQYTIQVRRWDDETKTWVRSNTITVTVTP